MEYLRSVRREVEVQAIFLDVFPDKFLVSQKVFYRPLMNRFIRNVQPRITLAWMRGEVYCHKIEFRLLRLPLYKNDILDARISGPCLSRPKQFRFALTDGMDFRTMPLEAEAIPLCPDRRRSLAAQSIAVRTFDEFPDPPARMRAGAVGPEP